MPNIKDFLPQPPWSRFPLPGRSQGGRFTGPEATEKLNLIHKKWRELDELQIKLHYDCMSSSKWAVLNSLDAIGLELTKGYPAISYYIDEKMRTIKRALEDLKFDKEIIG